MFPPIPPIDTRVDAGRDGDVASAKAHGLYASALKSARALRIPRRPRGQGLLIARWPRTSRRYYWRLDRWKRPLDRLREAARIGGVVCSACDDDYVVDKRSDLETFGWLVRVAELLGRRLGALVGMNADIAYSDWPSSWFASRLPDESAE